MSSDRAAAANSSPEVASRPVALVALHAALVGALALTPLLDAPGRGWAVLAVVVAYVIALPLIARAAGRRDLVALWAFLVPLSVCQLLPDWVLAAMVGTLAFPDTGGPRAGDVIPLAMAGMWVAPLLVTVAAARDSAWRAAGFALLLFAGAELAAPVIGLWEPTPAARQAGGVALYVLPAEAMLGAATLLAYRWTRDQGPGRRCAAAFAVSTLYLGALVLSHFLIDVADLRVTTG